MKRSKRASSIIFLGIFVLITGCTQSGNKTADNTKADPALAFNIVNADPAKYAGKKVSWVGASFGASINAGTITNFWMLDGTDQGDEAIFATKSDDEHRTDSAIAHGKIRFDFTRKVTGIIADEQVEYQNGAKTIKVPLLTRVIIDMPDHTP